MYKIKLLCEPKTFNYTAIVKQAFLKTNQVSLIASSAAWSVSRQNKLCVWFYKWLRGGRCLSGWSPWTIMCLGCRTLQVVTVAAWKATTAVQPHRVLTVGQHLYDNPTPVPDVCHLVLHPYLVALSEWFEGPSRPPDRAITNLSFVEASFAGDLSMFPKGVLKYCNRAINNLSVSRLLSGPMIDTDIGLREVGWGYVSFEPSAPAEPAHLTNKVVSTVVNSSSGALQQAKKRQKWDMSLPEEAPLWR